MAGQKNKVHATNIREDDTSIIRKGSIAGDLSGNVDLKEYRDSALFPDPDTLAAGQESPEGYAKRQAIIEQRSQSNLKGMLNAVGGLLNTLRDESAPKEEQEEAYKKMISYHKKRINVWEDRVELYKHMEKHGYFIDNANDTRSRNDKKKDFEQDFANAKSHLEEHKVEIKKDFQTYKRDLNKSIFKKLIERIRGVKTRAEFIS